MDFLLESCKCNFHDQKFVWNLWHGVPFDLLFSLIFSHAVKRQALLQTLFFCLFREIKVLLLAIFSQKMLRLSNISKSVLLMFGRHNLAWHHPSLWRNFSTGAMFVFVAVVALRKPFAKHSSFMFFFQKILTSWYYFVQRLKSPQRFKNIASVLQKPYSKTFL